MALPTHDSNITMLLRLEALIDEFEAELRAGRLPNLDLYAKEGNEEHQAEFLGELFALELAYDQKRREALGETCMESPKESTASQQRRSIETIDRQIGKIRCPYCRHPMDVPDINSDVRQNCPECRKNFVIFGHAAETTLTPPLAKRLGDFTIVDRLGSGRFGTVWLAWDLVLDRPVALKVPHVDKLDSDEMQLFVRESQSIARLQHPHIARIHGVTQVDDTVCLVTEFIDGITLEKRLMDDPLSARESAVLCEQICSALAYAHDRGVVHRDLSPTNILIDEKGEPHLIDFGLAHRSSRDAVITIDGHVFGTPAYMSPEQARGEATRVDERSDVYAVGVILYRMITGALPFPGNLHRTLHQVIHEMPRRPRLLNDSISPELESICLKAMEKEPGWRYASAKEMEADLRRYLDGRPVHASATSWARRFWLWCRRPARISEAGIILLFLAGLQLTWISIGVLAAAFDPTYTIRPGLPEKLLKIAVIGKGIQFAIGLAIVKRWPLAVPLGFLGQSHALFLLLGHLTGHFHQWDVFFEGTSPEYRLRHWVSLTCMTVIPWLWCVMALMAWMANPHEGRRSLRVPRWLRRYWKR